MDYLQIKNFPSNPPFKNVGFWTILTLTPILPGLIFFERRTSLFAFIDIQLCAKFQKDLMRDFRECAVRHEQTDKSELIHQRD